MPNAKFETIYSCHPKNGAPTPFTATLNGSTKTIAYCSTQKMVDELVLAFSQLHTYQYELERILESKLDGDQIRTRITEFINPPNKIYRD